MEDIRLSVIIPMYNEEEGARTTIARLVETLTPVMDDFELIVVNDGSTDQTLAVLDAIAAGDSRVRVCSYWKNGGRGKALRTGFAAARGDYIATIDADLSYEPRHLLEMMQVLDEERDIDMVLASAYMPGGTAVGVPRLRLWLSRLGNRVLQQAMSERLHTLTCIVRCYRREVIESLDLESNGKEIHLEILSKAMAMGFTIREIPAVLTSRQHGRSKFHLRATTRTHLLFTLFERPVLLFGLLGMLLTLTGLGIGIYIFILHMEGALNPGRPLLTLMVLFILGGMQVLAFGFLASQVNQLRREVLRIRRALGRYPPQPPPPH